MVGNRSRKESVKKRRDELRGEAAESKAKEKSHGCNESDNFKNIDLSTRPLEKS